MIKALPGTCKSLRSWQFDSLVIPPGISPDPAGLTRPPVSFIMVHTRLSHTLTETHTKTPTLPLWTGWRQGREACPVHLTEVKNYADEGNNSNSTFATSSLGYNRSLPKPV